MVRKYQVAAGSVDGPRLSVSKVIEDALDLQYAVLIGEKVIVEGGDGGR